MEYKQDNIFILDDTKRSNIWNLKTQNDKKIMRPDLEDRWAVLNNLLSLYFFQCSRERYSFLEIGVWKGDNVVKLNEEHGSIFEYIGVDPYGVQDDDAYEGFFWNNDKEADEIFKEASEKFNQCNAQLMRMTSKKFYHEHERQFDIILVDGDHRYDGALSDLEMSLKMLKKDGLLIVDDYGNNFHPEVEWAVRDFFNNNSDSFNSIGTQQFGFFQ